MRIRTPTHGPVPPLLRRYAGRDLEVNPLRVVVAGGDAFSTPEIAAAFEADPIEIFEAPMEPDLEDLLRVAIDGRLHGTIDAVICDGRRDPRRALALAERVREYDRALPVLVLIARADPSTAAIAKRAGFKTVRSPFADFELRNALFDIGTEDP